MTRFIIFPKKPFLGILIFLCSSGLLFAQNPDHQQIAAWYEEAQNLFKQKKFDESIALIKKGIDAAKGVDSVQAFGMGKIGYVCIQTNQLGEAERYLTEAEAKLKKSVGEYHPEYATTLQDLALLYSRKGQYEAAEQCYQKTLAIRKKIQPDSEKYYGVMASFGLFYMDQNRFEEAEPLLLQALEGIKKILGEEHPKYSTTMNNLAAFYEKNGNLEVAEKMYRQVLDLRKKVLGEKHNDYGRALLNLSALYTNLKRYSEAEILIVEAAEILRNEKDQLPYSVALSHLATVYARTGELEKAEALQLQSLAIKRKIFGDDNPSYAMSLNNIGMVYTQMKKYEQALDFYFKALEIFEKTFGQKHPSYLQSLRNIADTYLKMKNPEKALEYAYQALLFNVEKEDFDSSLLVKNPASLSEEAFMANSLVAEQLMILNSIKELEYETSGDLAQLEYSYQTLKTILRINERIKNNLGDEQDKFRTLKESNKIIAKSISTCLELADKKQQPALKAEAFSFAEQNKSILLSDATKAQRARSLGDLPDSLAFRELAFQHSKKRLEKAESEAKTETEKQKIRVELNKLNINITNFKKQIEKQYPKYYKLKYESNYTNLAAVQKQLNSESLLLEYFIADSLIYIFSVGKTHFEVIETKLNPKDFAESIKQLRKSLSNYEFIKENQEESFRLYSKYAYQLYKELLQPALKGKENIKNLIIVTDGEMGHLPFEAFLTAEVGSEKSYKKLPYLLHRYKVSYNYSAALMSENSKQKSGKSNGKMLAMAASYNNKKDSSATRALRAPHLRNLRDALQDLPAAKQEVTALSKSFVGTFLLSEEANEAKFKAAAGQYGVIHLAMHGLLNKRVPILSSLAFTENGDSTEDNFLEAWEISHLKLNAQLVVLSACETGYGKFQQGEGVMSLARSFMYAGVPSLVVSLWQVNDASTSAIMQLFYKNLAKGMDKAEALQQAKLAYIEIAGEDHAMVAHPAFWAAFVLLGDARPVALATHYGWMAYLPWLGGGLLAALGAGMYALRRRHRAL